MVCRKSQWKTQLVRMSLYFADKNHYYKDRPTATCVICKYDSTYNTHAQAKTIEICNYKSRDMVRTTHLFKSVNVFRDNEFQAFFRIKDYCAAECPTSSPSISSSIVNTKGIHCSDVYYGDPIGNPGAKLELACPNDSHLLGFENRNAHCDQPWKWTVALCILCKSSSGSEFSVCYSRCTRITSDYFIKNLIEKPQVEQKTDILQFVKFCGLQLDNQGKLPIRVEEILAPESLNKILFSCIVEEGTKANKSPKTHTLNAVYIGLLASIVVAIVMIVIIFVVGYLIRISTSIDKSKMTQDVDQHREEQEEYSVYNIESLRADGQQNDYYVTDPDHQFSHNPYYE